MIIAEPETPKSGSTSFRTSPGGLPLYPRSYFQPTTASCCQNVVAGVPDVILEFPHDTTRAVSSLLYSGALERFRNIRFILSHAGGTVPMLAGRIEAGAAFFGLEKIAPDGVEHELRRLYYDLANSANRPAFAAFDLSCRHLADLVRFRLPVCGHRGDGPRCVDDGNVCAGPTKDPPRQRRRSVSAPQSDRV